MAFFEIRINRQDLTLISVKEVQVRTHQRLHEQRNVMVKFYLAMSHARARPV